MQWLLDPQESREANTPAAAATNLVLETVSSFVQLLRHMRVTDMLKARECTRKMH